MSQEIVPAAATATVIVAGMNGRSAREIQELLAVPFDSEHIKAKPQVVKGNRALASFYIDARVVQERLDDVLGIEGWTAHYVDLPGGSVRCELAVWLGNQWITKSDVGSPSDQPDPGDRVKAAYSDALKRAAVHFGIGRHLYRMPTVWHEYDPAKKSWASPVPIPGRDRPTGTADVPPPPPPPPPPPRPPATTAPAPKRPALPATMSGMIERMGELERKMLEGDLCKPGGVFKVAQHWGTHNKLPAMLEDWPATCIPHLAEYLRGWYDAQLKASQERQNAKAAAAAAVPPPPPPAFTNPAPVGEDAIGEREAIQAEADERDMLEEGLYDMAAKLGRSGSQLIDAHRQQIGAAPGNVTIGKLTLAQLRALTTILQSLVSQA